MNHNVAFVEAWQQLMLHVATASIAAKKEGAPVTPEDVNAMVGRLNEMSKRVRGNRSPNAESTWADTRLYMAGSLRTILEELEAE